MPSVRLERLSFAFDDSQPILTGADLHLTEGWTALVGENGAGKTTLLRLLAGELQPAGGRVRLLPAAARVLLCPQRVERLGPPVRALAADGEAEAHRLRGLLGLEPAGLARWESLSPGERKRWQVGAALRADPDVLLLDEPTNHLDAAGRDLLQGALRGFRGLGLLVSHDRVLLERLATATLRLERGRRSGSTRRPTGRRGRAGRRSGGSPGSGGGQRRPGPAGWRRGRRRPGAPPRRPPAGGATEGPTGATTTSAPWRGTRTWRPGRRTG